MRDRERSGSGGLIFQELAAVVEREMCEANGRVEQEKGGGRGTSCTENH